MCAILLEDWAKRSDVAAEIEQRLNIKVIWRLFEIFLDDVFGYNASLTRKEFIQTMSNKAEWLLLPSMCRKKIYEVLRSDEPEV